MHRIGPVFRRERWSNFNNPRRAANNRLAIHAINIYTGRYTTKITCSVRVIRLVFREANVSAGAASGFCPPLTDPDFFNV